MGSHKTVQTARMSPVFRAVRPFGDSRIALIDKMTSGARKAVEAPIAAPIQGSRRRRGRPRHASEMAYNPPAVRAWANAIGAKVSMRISEGDKKGMLNSSLMLHTTPPKRKTKIVEPKVNGACGRVQRRTRPPIMTAGAKMPALVTTTAVRNNRPLLTVTNITSGSAAVEKTREADSVAPSPQPGTTGQRFAPALGPGCLRSARAKMPRPNGPREAPQGVAASWPRPWGPDLVILRAPRRAPAARSAERSIPAAKNTLLTKRRTARKKRGRKKFAIY